MALISHASKVTLKILQTRLQQYMNHGLHMLKLVLEKTEEPGNKLPTSAGSSKKQEFQKHIYFCYTDYAKTFDCVDHNQLWKIRKRWAYQTTWPAFWETYMQVKKQQLELDIEQQTGFNQERSTSRLYIVTLLI